MRSAKQTPHNTYFIGPAILLATVAVASRVKQTVAFQARRTIMNASSSTKSEKNLVATEKRDAKFWDRIADKYSKKPVEDEESYQKKLAMTQEYFRPDSMVFEFGCGTGSTAITHSPYVKHIYATDVSKNMIDIAKEKAAKEGVTNVKFEAISIDRLKIPDESYDVVLGLSILHLLPNKDEVIARVHKMLKPGGVFVSSTVCIGDFAGFFKYVGPVGASLGILPKLSVFTSNELKEKLSTAGFQIEREFQPARNKGMFLVARKKKN